MIICPRCGAQNGQRNPNPLKCTRCWLVFKRDPEKEQVKDVAPRVKVEVK